MLAGKRPLVGNIFVNGIIYIFLLKCFVCYLCDLRKGRNAFWTEMETYKLLIQYWTLFDPIVHTLNYFGSIEQAALGCAVWSEIPKFAKVLSRLR